MTAPNSGCLVCGEPADDNALMVAVLADKGIVTTRAIHPECQLLHIVGHLYRVCPCTGWDPASRRSAKELWTRLKDPALYRINSPEETGGDYPG